MTKKKKLRLGRVCIRGYVVDMDDPKMIELAVEALHDDVEEAVTRNYQELDAMIQAVKDPTAKESDISDFLKEDCDVDEEE